MEIEKSDGVQVRSAIWPRDWNVVRGLFEEYFTMLRDDPAVPPEIREKNRQPESDALETAYLHHHAVLLLAKAGEQVCGCVSVRLLAEREHAAEMKRLYVVPHARGLGLGRALIQACAAWARQQGARELLLDTLPAAMPQAVRLYYSLGFEPTSRYNENEGCCFAFFRLSLDLPPPHTAQPT